MHSPLCWWISTHYTINLSVQCWAHFHYRCQDIVMQSCHFLSVILPEVFLFVCQYIFAVFAFTGLVRLSSIWINLWFRVYGMCMCMCVRACVRVRARVSFFYAFSGIVLMQSDGVQPGIGDSKRSANTTGLIAEVKKGSFVAQQSVTSSTGTPVTPPTVFVPTDPLASGLQSPDPAPGRHKKPIPCLTEGCEFYGRHDTQFYCSKCSSQRWAATLPAVRARTEPHRLQPTETEGDMPRRRLDFQANTETGGGVPNGSGSEVKAQCKEPNCTNPASEEFSGYCSFGCVIEMSKKESDLEARERELFATLNSPHATISAGNAESQQVMPQRSQSMVMPLESVDRRFCRSMGCSQPAKAEFNGFCFYCYQSKTTAPFYNEGAERCLNSYCVRVGEQAYGGLCRECFVRASS